MGSFYQTAQRLPRPWRLSPYGVNLPLMWLRTDQFRIGQTLAIRSAQGPRKTFPIGQLAMVEPKRLFVKVSLKVEWFHKVLPIVKARQGRI